ncbi:MULTISPECIES: hypothetical protein [unclassified Nocardia]|uniref:hypothetical protein n=1 Tax=unclassified Nocardia TaxID=2637762 RepID=UPI001CE3E25B|nr:MULTISPECIES: hypothetical protein [unclassified Nocardia]
MADPPIAPPALTVAERSQRLTDRIDWLAEHATCRVQVRGELSAVVVLSGPPPDHVLHATLTVVTAGVWALIWLAVVHQRQPTRFRLAVDEAGIVRGERLADSTAAKNVSSADE